MAETGDKTPHRTSLDLWLSEETHWGEHGGSASLSRSSLFRALCGAATVTKQRSSRCSPQWGEKYLEKRLL